MRAKTFFCSPMKPRWPEEYLEHNGHSKKWLNKFAWQNLAPQEGARRQDACLLACFTEQRNTVSTLENGLCLFTLAELQHFCYNQQMVYFPLFIYLSYFPCSLLLQVRLAIFLETGIGIKGSLVMLYANPCLNCL